MSHPKDATGAIKCRMIGGELLCEPATHRNMLHGRIHHFPLSTRGSQAYRGGRDGVSVIRGNGRTRSRTTSGGCDMSQVALFYVLSIELAAGLLTASGRIVPGMEIVTADQAVNVLKTGGGPLAIAGTDFGYFQTLAALHGWKFASDMEYTLSS